MKPILADRKACTGCLVCMDACHRSAIRKVWGEDGHVYVNVDGDLCVGCKACEKICPPKVYKKERTDGFKDEVYAAWAIDDKLREKSSSGGVFAALAKNVLRGGGIVYGAKMEGTECSHVGVRRMEELYVLQGSKYIQSNTKGIYKEISARLGKGEKVLFSGLPCQTAALLCYIKSEEKKKNLFLVDVACGGVPSKFLIEKFSGQYKEGVSSILSFRDKSEGWKSKGFQYKAVIKDGNGKIIKLEKKNLLVDGFASGLVNRWSCYNCQFANVNRKSDITVADFWGDEDFPEEHFKGLSSMIVHSKKGRILVSESQVKVVRTSFMKVLLGNPRLVYGKSSLCYMLERRWISFFFHRLSYENLNRIYASDYRFYDVMIICQHLIKKVLEWWDSRKRKKYILQLIKHL